MPELRPPSSPALLLVPRPRVGRQRVAKGAARMGAWAWARVTLRCPSPLHLMSHQPLCQKTLVPP